MSNTASIGSNYQSSVKNTYNNQNNTAGYDIGDEFEATVVGFSSGKAKLIAGNNMTFEASFSGIQLNKGDVLNFKVLANGSKGLTLELLQNSVMEGVSLPGGQMSSEDIMELFEQSKFSEEEDIFEIKSVWEAPSQEEKDTARAIAAIRNRLDNVSNNVSIAVINQLLGHGISLQNLRLELVDQVLQEVEALPESLSDEELDALVNDSAQALGLSKEGLSQKLDLVKTLGRHQLPLNGHNMAHLEKTLQTFEEVKDLEDTAIAGLLEEDSITLEDLYYAKFSSAGEAKDVPEETWKDLSREVAKIFKREDLERSPENIAMAKFLVGNEIPVNNRNLQMVTHLRNLANSYSEEALMDLSAQAIRQGKGPMDISMAPENIPIQQGQTADGNADAALYAQELTGEDLAVAEALDIPLTLQQLKEIADHREDYPAITEPATRSARLALMEIQLKLTTEAAHRLARSGIEIDTMPLLQAVEELRALERQTYENALAAADVFPGAENTAAMAGVFNNLPEVRPLGAGTYRDLMERREPFTMDGIQRSGSKLLEEGYEIFMTAPSQKYGDAIGKVLPEIPGLLETLEIEPSKENVRAAAILTRNNMDVTEENILEVKVIDAKLDRIQDTLHPAIAAEMIRDGLNPLQMHVDDMLSYIEDFNEEYGEGLKDKIPEYILDLDNKKELAPEERSAMMAVYRLMHQIGRYGGAAIGANVKSGAEPTFKNLLESSKYYVKTGARATFADKVVDDSTGGAELRQAQEKSIRELLENTIHAAHNEDNMERGAELARHVDPVTPHDINQYVYSELLMKALGDHLNSAVFEKLAAKNENFMDTPLWELTEQIALEETGEYQAQRAQELYRQITGEMLSVSPQAAAWMESMGIPLTMRNMATAEKIISQPGFPYDNAARILESRGGTTDIGPETALPEEETAVDLSQAVEEALEDVSVDRPNKDLLWEIHLIQNGIKVQNFISAKQDNYRIPVKLNGRLSTLNIHVPGGKMPQGGVNVAISLETGLGKFNSFIRSGEDGGLQMALNADGPLQPVLERNQARQMLADCLAEAGFENIAFLNADDTAENEDRPVSTQEKNPETKQKMFALARAIAKGLSEIENSNRSLIRRR